MQAAVGEQELWQRRSLFKQEGSKGQLMLKKNCLPKKEQNALKIVSWVPSACCFLGEVMARQFRFEIYWPLGTARGDEKTSNKIILQTCLSWNSLHQAAYHWQRSHKANWVAQLVPCATWYISIYIYCHNPDLFVFPPLSHHSFCSFQTSCNLLLASSSTSADFSYQLFISTALWHTFKTILSDSHLFFL